MNMNEEYENELFDTDRMAAKINLKLVSKMSKCLSEYANTENAHIDPHEMHSSILTSALCETLAGILVENNRNLFYAARQIFPDKFENKP